MLYINLNVNNNNNYIMVTFTRYLYSKDDVEIAIIGSLLQKDKDAALFWVYELYFSGFWEEVKLILWKIYFSIYSVNNASLENYMKKKEEKIETDKDKEMFLLTFVSNMIKRKSNTDVFILAGVCTKIEQDEAMLGKSLWEMLHLQDYEAICQEMERIISSDDDSGTESKILVQDLTRFFKEKGCTKLAPLKKYKYDGVSNLLILISRVMTLFTELSNKKEEEDTPKKTTYVVCKEKDIEPYRTREVELGKEKPRDIFPQLASKSPFTDGFLSIFRSGTDEENLYIYRQQWIAQAYQTTPVWKERIEKFCGSVHEEQVVWENDDLEEEFYQKYNYDTDEQPLEIQQRNIPMYDKRMSLLDFQKKYKGDGIYEPCEEVLEALIDQ